jgi:hypothetical protein
VASSSLTGPIKVSVTLPLAPLVTRQRYKTAAPRPAERVNQLDEMAAVACDLVGVYAGLVLLATQVFRFHGTVAVAAATLVAAALFSPLRRRVQWVVDQRFNRARYDAEQTVATFAARLKDTVDLDSVRDDLTTVVDHALEPPTCWCGSASRAEASGGQHKIPGVPGVSSLTWSLG